VRSVLASCREASDTQIALKRLGGLEGYVNPKGAAHIVKQFKRSLIATVRILVHQAQDDAAQRDRHGIVNLDWRQWRSLYVPLDDFQVGASPEWQASGRQLIKNNPQRI
jgi:hypothetical protein